MIGKSIRYELKENRSRDLRKIAVSRANNQCGVAASRYSTIRLSPDVADLRR